MNPRSTWFWTFVAAALFAFIFFFERHLHKPPEGPVKVLPALQPAAVTEIQILPKGQLEIRADRTNGIWELTRPIVYPAQAAGVETLLAALESLTPALSVTAQELKNLRQADEKYGFEPPQTTLVLHQGEDQSLIHVGYRTPPGDQVFVQVVGVGEVYVVDADLLKLIPTQADEWRSTNLVDLSTLVFDRLMVTNLGKVFELQHSPDYRLWRMILPGWEPRADSDKVIEALRQLQALPVTRFVTDDPKADLDSFGLQTPDLSLAFVQGSNTVLLLEFGKSPTNSPTQLYARRHDQNAVVMVPKELLAPWRGALEGFRDRHLITLPGRVDEIQVHAQDDFTVQRDARNSWRVLPHDFPQGFPGDPGLMNEFLTNLINLQVVGFPKDVVTTPDLPAWGLDAPVRTYTLKAATNNPLAGLTNVVIAQLDFGTNQDDKIFARRADETSLYTVNLADFTRLPSASWQLRERRIWNFSENDVTGITIHQNGKTRKIVRHGPKSWSLAPGSEGIINDLALDEVVHRLGELAAVVWVENGDAHRASYGFIPDNHQLAIELKDGRTLSIQFGGNAPSGFPYAMTTLDGQPWIFEFPWGVHQFVQMYLTIPAYIR
jgi:hypothetical protein